MPDDTPETPTPETTADLIREARDSVLRGIKVGGAGPDSLDLIDRLADALEQRPPAIDPAAIDRAAEAVARRWGGPAGDAEAVAACPPPGVAPADVLLRRVIAQAICRGFGADPTDLAIGRGRGAVSMAAMSRSPLAIDPAAVMRAKASSRRLEALYSAAIRANSDLLNGKPGGAQAILDAAIAAETAAREAEIGLGSESAPGRGREGNHADAMGRSDDRRESRRRGDP